MKIGILGSGSGGNSILIRSEGCDILVDAGFSGKSIERRLAALGADPEKISAIVVTHEHSDHTKGVGIFARRFGTPIYLTEPTDRACQSLFKGTEDRVFYQVGRPFEIGPFLVEPFLTAHDAIDPVAVAIQDRGTGCRVGVATDLGRPTSQVRYALQKSHFLILEANHDEFMLLDSDYPWSIKSRIASSHGHLSNNEAAKLVEDLYHRDLVGVVLAHLSSESNRPDLALDVVGGTLNRLGFKGLLEVATQDEPLGFFDVPDLRERAGPPQLKLL